MDHDREHGDRLSSIEQRDEPPNFPSIAYTGRLITDTPEHRSQAEASIQNGAGSQSGRGWTAGATTGDVDRPRRRLHVLVHDRVRPDDELDRMEDEDRLIQVPDLSYWRARRRRLRLRRRPSASAAATTSAATATSTSATTASATSASAASASASASAASASASATSAATAAAASASASQRCAAWCRG